MRLHQINCGHFSAMTVRQELKIIDYRVFSVLEEEQSDYMGPLSTRR